MTGNLDCNSASARDSSTSRNPTCRVFGGCARIGLALALLCGVLACTTREPPTAPTSLNTVSGHEIVYRFDIGRLYRARYAEMHVDFELLEPKQQPPPGARLGYREIRVRPGLHLVTWTGDPRFHVTMLLDLERKTVYFSALYDGRQSVFETAELISIESISMDP